MSAPDAPVDEARELGGRYRLVRYIAKGGMAEVWEGYDAVLSRPVAVKILLAHLATDTTVLERFRREAITAAGLAHPGVIATYDTGVDHGTAWIVMELVRGRTLRDLMNDRGPLDAVLAVRLTGQITDALAHAHRAGLVHRDVKPGNVLLCDDDGPVPRAKVTDFGIAKATEGLGLDLTQTGMVMGTPKYLSPEQVEGMEPDARADLYSLGGCPVRDADRGGAVLRSHRHGGRPGPPAHRAAAGLRTATRYPCRTRRYSGRTAGQGPRRTDPQRIGPPPATCLGGPPPG